MPIPLALPLAGAALGLAPSALAFMHGKSKGKNWAEALVDDESIIDITIGSLPKSKPEEE